MKRPKKQMACFKLPPYILVWLRAQPGSQAVLIERALVKAYGIERPNAGIQPTPRAVG